MDTERELFLTIKEYVAHRHALNVRIRRLIMDGELEHLIALLRTTGETQMDDALSEAFCLSYTLRAKTRLLHTQGALASYVWIGIPSIDNINTNTEATRLLELVDEFIKVLKECLAHRKHLRTSAFAESQLNANWMHEQDSGTIEFALLLDLVCHTDGGMNDLENQIKKKRQILHENHGNLSDIEDQSPTLEDLEEGRNMLLIVSSTFKQVADLRRQAAEKALYMASNEVALKSAKLEIQTLQDAVDIAVLRGMNVELQALGDKIRQQISPSVMESNGPFLDPFVFDSRDKASNPKHAKIKRHRHVSAHRNFHHLLVERHKARILKLATHRDRSHHRWMIRLTTRVLKAWRMVHLRCALNEWKLRWSRRSGQRDVHLVSLEKHGGTRLSDLNDAFSAQEALMNRIQELDRSDEEFLRFSTELTSPFVKPVNVSKPENEYLSKPNTFEVKDYSGLTSKWILRLMTRVVQAWRSRDVRYFLNSWKFSCFRHIVSSNTHIAVVSFDKMGNTPLPDLHDAISAQEVLMEELEHDTSEEELSLDAYLRYSHSMLD